MPGDQNNRKGIKVRDNTIKIKVIRDAYLTKKVGSTICFDLLDGHEPSYVIALDAQFCEFKNEIERSFQVPADMQRWWVFMRRGNNTYRPSRLLSIEEHDTRIGDIEKSIGSEGCLDFYLEVEYGILSKPVYPLPKRDDEVMIFVKFFNAKRFSFKYVGRLSLQLSNRPVNILEKLREMAEIGPGEGLTLFEEISFDPKVLCHPLKLDISFEDNKIIDGDIIWIQTSESHSKNQHRRHNVSSFLQFVLKKSISLDLYQDILRKYSLFKSSGSSPMDELELSLSDHDCVLKDLGGLSPPCEPWCQPTVRVKSKEHQERAASVTLALSLPRGQLSDDDSIIKGWDMKCDRTLSDSEAHHLLKLRISVKCGKHYKKLSSLSLPASQPQGQLPDEYEQIKGTYLGNKESMSDSEVSGMSDAKVPTWLVALTLQTTFHTKCSIHEKNLDTFCTSCFAIMCARCDHNHANHKKLRVYKVHNRLALDLEAFRTFHQDVAEDLDAEKIWGKDDISITISHGRKMIYIHPCEKSFPSRVKVPGTSYCKFCRKRMVKKNPFCSAFCKVQYLFRANVWKCRPPQG